MVFDCQRKQAKAACLLVCFVKSLAKAIVTTTFLQMVLLLSEIFVKTSWFEVSIWWTIKSYNYPFLKSDPGDPARRDAPSEWGWLRSNWWCIIYCVRYSLCIVYCALWNTNWLQRSLCRPVKGDNQPNQTFPLNGKLDGSTSTGCARPPVCVQLSPPLPLPCHQLPPPCFCTIDIIWYWIFPKKGIVYLYR